MSAGSGGRVPLATYRLQLGPGLTFDDAAALVDYLAALGISDCYTSPFFETASTSSHGYDVSDHNRIREELGGEPALLRFADALRAQGLGLLIDVVPNHMGIAGNRNAWWWDVLENGPASRYAPFFDIDWTPVKRELADKVLLPTLGDQYGLALDGGQLALELADGAFVVRYYDTRLPVAPRTCGRILTHRIDGLQATLGADHPGLNELKALTAWFVTLPPTGESDPDRLAARSHDVAAGRQRLTALLADAPEIRAFVEDNVSLFNGTPGDPASFDLLDSLLAEQAYRVAFWRVAAEEINRKHRAMVDGHPTPGPNTEYLIYQTLVGAWPIGVERLRRYVIKAIHEAKSHTSWINPNARYDEVVVAFVEAILDPGRAAPFLDDFAAFATRIAHFGALNSLAQTLIKITAPGVPDCYQGTELPDLSLVDPDNRRPVDFALRRRLLEALVAEIESTHDLAALARHLLKTKDDGRVKLYVIRQALGFRQAEPALFQRGEYRPLATDGPLAEHACAFARVGADTAAITVVPRLLARRGSDDDPIGEYWGDETRLVVPAELGTSFVDVLTGQRLTVEDGALGFHRLFEHVPLALLRRAAG